MEKKIGFIGLGNMARAIISGILKSQIVKEKDIIGTAVTDETLERVKSTYKIETTKDNTRLAKESDIIFLAVKPHLYDEVIDEIKEYIKEDVIIIVIAAGKSIEYVENRFNRKIKLVRTMPNTPAMVGEGMTAITFNEFISKDEKKYILDIFESLGKVEEVNESLYHGVTAVSGSSPAYVYMFIEALADGGVMEGLPRDKAYVMAAQAVLGAAKMVLETGKHPGELKDNVCSPGGTTIAAVAELESRGLRNAVINATNICARKSKEMSI